MRRVHKKTHTVKGLGWDVATKDRARIKLAMKACAHETEKRRNRYTNSRTKKRKYIYRFMYVKQEARVHIGSKRRMYTEHK